MNDNGKKGYENKNERVSDHSVLNINGKKYRDEDKSVRTYLQNKFSAQFCSMFAEENFLYLKVDTQANEIKAEIEKMPKEDQAAAYKIYVKWLRNQLVSILSTYIFY